MRRICCLILLVAALVPTGCGVIEPTSLPVQRLGYRPVTNPSSFVYVTNGPTGFRTSVELRSAATGRLVKVIATFGNAFTNNGLALSPDARDVYVTLIGHRTLRIVQIDAVEDSRRFIADGEQPTISPNGHLLAYVAGEFDGRQRIAVRDLSSGRVRVIDLGRLLGRSMDVFNGSVAWVGGGTDLVAVPQPAATLTSREVGSRAAQSRDRVGACGAIGASAKCLLVVHVPSAGRRLTARVVSLRGLGSMSFEVMGDAAQEGSVLIGGLARNRTMIDRVAIAGTHTSVFRLVSLGFVLPVAFDLSGTHLLYLVGHSPPALWVGQIAAGRLVDRHRLVANADLGAVAW